MTGVTSVQDLSTEAVDQIMEMVARWPMGRYHIQPEYARQNAQPHLKVGQCWAGQDSITHVRTWHNLRLMN